MKNIRNITIGLCVALLATTYSFAQSMGGFEDKSPFLVGQGDAKRAYGVVIPDKVTVELPDGTVLHAGDIVMVPGENITVTDVNDEYTEQEPDAFNRFEKKEGYTAKPEGKGVVAVAIHITTPGVIVRHEDGREAKTGDTIKLIIDHEALKQTAEQAEPPTVMSGFANK